MNKRIGGLFLIFVVLLASSIVLGQDDLPGGIGELKEQAEDIGEKVEGARAVSWESYKQEYWDGNDFDLSGFFLRNKFLSTADEFLTKLNWVFVILFARSYSFSVQMLFVFMLWLFTAMSLENYFIFFKVGWQRGLAAFGVTLLIAHLQIFNLIATWAIKAVFVRPSGTWSLVSAILLFVALFVYLALNKIFSKKLKEFKQKGKEKKRDTRIKKTERFIEGVEKGMKGP